MKKYIPYIAIVILALMLLDQCSKSSQIDSTKAFLNDSISYYKNKIGQEVAFKTALQGDNKQLGVLLSKQIDSTRQLANLVKKYKSIASAGNITTVTKIDTIKIHYKEQVPISFFRKWSKKNKYYSIYGTSNQLGISIDSLSIPNTLSFAIGKKSTGFWKSEFNISAVNSNKFVKTTGLDAYSYSEPIKRFGISFYVGYGMSKNGLSPSIGIAGTFTFLRF